MAEVAVVLSALQATTQLIEQALRVLSRLRRAHQRQKSLVDLLLRHETELNSVKAIIGIVDDEEDLRTEGVITELCRLRVVESKLVKMLEELDPRPSSKMRQFTRQLVQGSTDEKNLCAIMDELAHVKGDLLLRIQVAHVGVLRIMGKQLVANAEVIQRIDQFLRESVGGCEGLRIARLLKGKDPDDDGNVLLPAADLKKLAAEECSEETDDSGDETVVDDSETSMDPLPAKIERVILRNLARDQAFQINAALGKDIWTGIDRLIIKDNEAVGNAVQVNYAMTLESAKFLREWQREMMRPTQNTSRMHLDSAPDRLSRNSRRGSRKASNVV